MTERFDITREIGIDAAHRVPLHGSKCRNLHGHRYTIQATCSGPLVDAGEQSGMVLDFGFLKEEMMAEIDAPCDHGTIIYQHDYELLNMFMTKASIDKGSAWGKSVRASSTNGWGAGDAPNGMKVYVVTFPPTAEELARHWFERLAPRVAARSESKARLRRVRVWETPNCYADFER